jgi:hypothetical protein
MVTGKHPIESRKTRDEFWRAFAPRTLYRYIQTTSQRGVRSLSTSNLLVSPITIPERVSFVLGITPIDIDKSMYIDDELFKSQEKQRARVSTFGSNVAEANLRGDYREALRLYRSSYMEGLSSVSVGRSASSYETKMREPLAQRQFKDSQVRERRARLGLER